MCITLIISLIPRNLCGKVIFLLHGLLFPMKEHILYIVSFAIWHGRDYLVLKVIDDWGSYNFSRQAKKPLK